METTKHKVISEMLGIAGFTMLDADIWCVSFENGEDCYVQNVNNVWEVYYKNLQINHTDEQMISGLSILVSETD